MRCHDLALLGHLVDPEHVSDEVEGALVTLAGHEQVSLAEEWLVVEPVDIETVNGHSVVLAVDRHTLEPSLLVEAHLVAKALILVTSLNDLNGVRIYLTHSCDRVVALVKVLAERELSSL